MKDTVCVEAEALPVSLGDGGFFPLANRVPAPARPCREPIPFGLVQPRPDLQKSFPFVHPAEPSLRGYLAFFLEKSNKRVY
jgi:hypothetical protein